MYRNKVVATIATYNRTAAAMAAKFNSLGARRDDVERVIQLWGKPNPRIVELACGNGRDAAVMLEHTSDYLGMDAASEMIAIARQNLPDAEFQVTDFENFVFPDGVDIIFAFAALLHANRQTFEDICDRAESALNENGLFFISLKEGPYRQHNERDELGVRTFYFYDLSTIIGLLGNSLKIVYHHNYELGGQIWLSLILQKQSS